MTRTRPIIRPFAWLSILALVLPLLGLQAANAAVPRIAHDILGDAPARRGTAGSSYHSLFSRSFRVDGSPYDWYIESTQSRSGPGVPPSDPDLRIIASRRASTGERPEQVHTWSFDLAAGSLSFDGELRHVSLDTGLIPAYGAIFMDLEDLSPLKTAKNRCPKTGEVLSNRARRTGVLRGSVTFLPGFSDPHVPDEVNITHVRARIERTKYTGNECTYPGSCEPGKTVSGLQLLPGGGYQLAGGEGPGFNGIVLFEVETDGVADLTHIVFAIGDTEVLQTSSTAVELLSDVGKPFIRPGDSMGWTKGAKDTHQTSKCRRVTWTLMAPTGSFLFRLDSGDETLAAPTTAEFEVVNRR